MNTNLRSMPSVLIVLLATVGAYNLQANGKKPMTELQKQFLQLERSVGIVTPDKQVSLYLQATYPIRGRQGSQEQFNKARSMLHKLLSQSPVDSAKIKEAISAFAKLNPARWPQPADYSKLLQAKVAAEEAGLKKGALKKPQPPLPALPPKKQPPLPPLPDEYEGMPNLVEIPAAMPEPSAPLEPQRTVAWGDVR